MKGRYQNDSLVFAEIKVFLALGALDGYPPAAVLGARKEGALLLPTLKPPFILMPTSDKVKITTEGDRKEGPPSLQIEGG